MNKMIIIIFIILIRISNRRFILSIYFYLNIYISVINKSLNFEISYFVISRINIMLLLL